MPMSTEQIIMATFIPAIVFLFGLEMKHHKSTRDELKETSKRLDICQAKCTALEIKIAKLEVPVESLTFAAEKVATSLENVATEVVEKLKVLVEKKP
jgi:TRAP-type uncharacterized transport system fused permease subunit